MQRFKPSISSSSIIPFLLFSSIGAMMMLTTKAKEMAMPFEYQQSDGGNKEEQQQQDPLHGFYTIFVVALGCIGGCFLLSVVAEKCCTTKTRAFGTVLGENNDGKTVCLEDDLDGDDDYDGFDNCDNYNRTTNTINPEKITEMEHQKASNASTSTNAAFVLPLPFANKGNCDLGDAAAADTDIDTKRSHSDDDSISSDNSNDNSEIDEIRNSSSSSIGCSSDDGQYHQTENEAPPSALDWV